MNGASSRTIKLEIASRYEMLEMIQTVLEQIASMVGFGEEATHFMSVAVRESVVNAIKHGNQANPEKRVTLTFVLSRSALDIQVQDEGLGFDPRTIPDPLAQDNLLKTDGRGIFYIRSFMDAVSYSFPSRGGTLVTMSKRLAG